MQLSFLQLYRAQSSIQLALARAANSIEFFSSSSSSSTYFSKSKIKFEFSNLIIYEFEFDKSKLFRVQVRVQVDEYPKSRQLFHPRAHAIKKIKIFRSSTRFKTIPPLFSTIEIVSIVITIFGIFLKGERLLLLLNCL